MTLENLQEDGYEEPGYAQDTNNECLLPERRGIEDPAVQEQDRDLDHGYCKCVS